MTDVNLGDLNPVDASAVAAAAICDGQAPTKGRIVMWHAPTGAGWAPTLPGNSIDPDGVPAIIVRHWGGGTCNLRLLHDGPPSESEWQTSVQHRSVAPDGSACWSWPRRVNP